VRTYLRELHDNKKLLEEGEIIKDFPGFLYERFEPLINEEIKGKGKVFEKIATRNCRPVKRSDLWDAWDYLRNDFKGINLEGNKKQKPWLVNIKPGQSWKQFSSYRDLAENKKGFENKMTHTNIRYHLRQEREVYIKNICEFNGKPYLFTVNKKDIINSLQAEKRKVKKGKKRNKPKDPIV
jgi:hypothetical protein